MKKNNRVTVGITTCYGKKQLLSAVKSIKDSKGIRNFEVVVIADLTPISLEVKKGLHEMDVTLIENDIPSSQFAKQRQLISKCKSEFIVLTQDDVLFDKYALVRIIKELKKGTTFVGIRNEPVEAKTLIERGINVGTRLNNSIARLWNKGDNYLAVLGRVMAFRTEWLRSLDVHPGSVSLDAYLYLENKKKGGTYQCLWDTYLLFRNPDNITEHIRKSSRFQNSKYEMLSYEKFGNLDREYAIPRKAIIIAALAEFMHDKIGFIIYLYIYIYTRLFKQKPQDCLTALWKVDLSTKNF